MNRSSCILVSSGPRDTCVKGSGPVELEFPCAPLTEAACHRPQAFPTVKISSFAFERDEWALKGLGESALFNAKLTPLMITLFTIYILSSCELAANNNI
jgi:hypothetical protein